jgi:hypothetical protein
MTEKAPTVGLLFSTVKVINQFSQEMDWATFWTTFSQTLTLHRKSF